jgi:hypothetical protein
MTDRAPDARADAIPPGQDRLDALQCPHCDEVTMPNLLPDGSYVCSCTAERALPLNTARGTPWDGAEAMMPPPVDDRTFTRGPAEHAMPGGGERTATEAERRAKAANLPGDHGQFGRFISTEEFKPLEPPPTGGAPTPRKTDEG